MCANVALLVGAALPVRACARMPAAHVGLSGSGLAISAALHATAAPPAASFVRTQQLSAAVGPHAERSGCFPSNHRASSAPMPPGRSCLCRPVSGRRFRPSSDVRSRVLSTLVCIILCTYSVRSLHAPPHGCIPRAPFAAASFPYYAGALAPGASALSAPRSPAGVALCSPAPASPAPTWLCAPCQLVPSRGSV